jgi:hypothetical protein
LTTRQITYDRRTGPDANLTKNILACYVFKTIVNVICGLVCFFFFLIKEPPIPQFTPKIQLATLYTFDLG